MAAAESDRKVAVVFVDAVITVYKSVQCYTKKQFDRLKLCQSLFFLASAVFSFVYFVAFYPISGIIVDEKQWQCE